MGAVIPARDEEGNIGSVVRSLLGLRAGAGRRLVDDLVVCDNGSRDATAALARQAGARVVEEPARGYGSACLAGLRALRPVDVVLFVDADQSCEPRQSRDLLEAIAAGADLAVGSRVLGAMQPGSLSLPQSLGNRVASLLILALWGHRVTDLGPFRAIRCDSLRRIGMRDRAYGWTVEMQVKAIMHGLRVVEVPVDTARRRFGESKVGGTVAGVVGASFGIMYTMLKLRLRGARPERRQRERGKRCVEE